MKKYSTTSGEQTWYIIANICTFGIYYFMKIMVKKAIVEALNSEGK